MALKLLANQVFPPVGKGILVNTRPNTIYVDGKATDRVDGIRCDVRALPDLTPVTVKVPGAAAPMSNDELARHNGVAQFVWVEFTGFVGTQYIDRRSGGLRVSATAASVKITDAPTDSDMDIDLG